MSTVSYTYNSAGRTSVSAWLANGFETTAYNYGVTQSGGSAIDSNDLVGATQAPDPATGLPSSTITSRQTVDALGETLTYADPNGTTHAYTYNVLGQQVADAVTALGAGIDGSVRELDTAFNALGASLPSQATVAPTPPPASSIRSSSFTTALTSSRRSLNPAVGPSTPPQRRASSISTPSWAAATTVA